jgi:ribosomal protein S18 acetylase RimI-like enzyme
VKNDSLFDSVILRPAAPDEAAAIGDLARDAFSMYTERIGREPEPMVADYAEIIQRGGVMVAMIGKQIAGYVEMYVRDDHLFIDKIAVSPEFQNQGIAHAVYGLIAITARAHGLPRLRLYTNAAMHENISLYEQAAGFTVTERKEEHGFERVFMDRELGAPR